MQLLSVPEDAPEDTLKEAREVLRALRDSPVSEDRTREPQALAALVASLRPWLAGAADAAPASRTELEALAAQVADVGMKAGWFTPRSAGREGKARDGLYHYADCDDLPPGADVADPAVSLGS